MRAGTVPFLLEAVPSGRRPWVLDGGIVVSWMPALLTSRSRRSRSTRAIALATGALFVFAPWVGAAVLMLAGGLRSVRSWSWAGGLAAVLVAAASAAAGTLDVAMTVQLLAVALLVGVGREVRGSIPLPLIRAGVTGMAVGLVVAGLIGAVEVARESGFVASIVEGRTIAAETTVRASGWMVHPNLWGAAAVVPSLLVAVVGLRERHAGLMVAAVGGGLLMVLTSGSRSGLAGLIVGYVVVLVQHVVRRRAGAAHGPGLVLALAVVLAVATVTASPGLRERWLGGIGIERAASGSRNLLRSSEDLTDPVWWRPSIEVERIGPGSTGGAVHGLTRDGGRWTDRVQQRIMVEPRVPHAFAVEFRSPPAGLDPVPALIAWSGTEPVATELVVAVPVEGDRSVRARGPMEVLHASVASLEDGWRRLEVVFSVTTEVPISVELGFAPRTVDPPDRSEVGASDVLVRRMQFEVGAVATPYVATAPPDRRRLEASAAVDARRELFGALLARIAERPWLGWGGEGLAEARTRSADAMALAPNHEHSLPLAFAFRYGSVGVVALFVLLVGVGGTSPTAWAIVVAVVTMNLVDLTFVSPGVYVPMAVGVGWLQRSSAAGDARPFATTELAR